jgi:hypothetical protein
VVVEEELGWDELKKRKFAQIQIDGGKPIPFETWGGISPFVADRLGEMSRVSVRYFIKGNRLRVRRDFDGDYWYTLIEPCESDPAKKTGRNRD